MRVIGGSAKGRKLVSVPGESTRPVLDRVKTSVFDIIRPELAGAHFLDLFAGSGSVGIEALSQGAKRCVFIDIEPKAIDTIKRNLENTRLKEQAEIKHTDAFRYLKGKPQVFDFVYVAPPQYETLWSQALYAFAERPDWVKPGGKVIAQIDPREYEELSLKDLALYRTEKYGNTMLVFFERTAT